MPSAGSSRRSRKIARGFAIAGLVVVALLIVARLVLDPVATRQTRKALTNMKGFNGNFERVHVTVFPPQYTITRLALREEGPDEQREPMFYADTIHAGIDWRRLLHGKVGAGVRIMGPKATLGPARAEKAAEKAEEKVEKGAHRAPDVSRQLADVIPFQIERVEVFDGEVLFRDVNAPGRPEVWLHDVALVAQNLASRKSLAAARPATVSGRGVVGKSGHMDLFVSADPLASPLAFAGRFELVGLRTAELYRMIEPKTKLQAPAGTLDLFAEFRAMDGRIRGGIKPVLKNVEVRPAEDGVWDRVKAWAANLGVKLASDRVPERNAVATTIPIEGKLVDPDVQLWPAVLGVVRNAFIEGVASGFSNLPPPQASHPEAPLEQAKKALDKDAAAPKAQPATGQAK
jgi:hypothetical protein